jgi:hypothetical protein
MLSDEISKHGLKVIVEEVLEGKNADQRGN